MNTQKGFAYVSLVLLVFLVIGGSSLFYIKNKKTIIDESIDKTLEFKTYTDSDFNFSIDIPLDTKILKNSIGAEPTVTFEHSDTFFVIRKYENGQYGNSIDEVYTRKTSELYEKIEINLDNTRSLKYVLPAYSEGGEAFPDTTNILFEHNGNIYHIEFHKKDLGKLEEDILSTIKFEEIILDNNQVKSESNSEIKSNVTPTTEKAYGTYDKLSNEDNLFDIKSIKALGSGSDKYEVEIEMVGGYWEEGMPNPGLKLTNTFKTILISENIEVDLQTWNGVSEEKWFTKVYFYEFAKMFNELKKDEKRCDFFGATVTYGVVDKMGFFCGV